MTRNIMTQQCLFCLKVSSIKMLLHTDTKGLSACTLRQGSDAHGGGWNVIDENMKLSQNINHLYISDSYLHCHVASGRLKQSWCLFANIISSESVVFELMCPLMHTYMRVAYLHRVRSCSKILSWVQFYLCLLPPNYCYYVSVLTE